MDQKNRRLIDANALIQKLREVVSRNGMGAHRNNAHGPCRRGDSLQGLSIA